MSFHAALLGSRPDLEAYCRAAARSVYFGDDTVLCRVLGGQLAYADTRDRGIAPHLAMDGFWESWVTLAMARALRPGDYCLDVGANHGYYTLLMALGAGPSGRVVAVEPQPRMVSLLERSIEVNGLEQYTSVVAAAALERDGSEVHFSFPPGYGLNASLMRVAAHGDETFTCLSVTIDSLTAAWPRLALVKIDAEGAEESIWRGARQAWARFSEVRIIMELNTSRYADPEGFLTMIEADGFALAAIDWDGAVTSVTRQRVLEEHPGEDWMLFLEKPRR